MYYYRDNNKNEVDLVLRAQGKLIPIEIKSSATFDNSFLKGLNYFSALLKERLGDQYLVYNGEDEFIVNQVKVINFRSTKKLH